MKAFFLKQSAEFLSFQFAQILYIVKCGLYKTLIATSLYFLNAECFFCKLLFDCVKFLPLDPLEYWKVIFRSFFTCNPIAVYKYIIDLKRDALYSFLKNNLPFTLTVLKTAPLRALLPPTLPLLQYHAENARSYKLNSQNLKVGIKCLFIGKNMYSFTSFLIFFVLCINFIFAK